MFMLDLKSEKQRLSHENQNKYCDKHCDKILLLKKYLSYLNIISL